MAKLVTKYRERRTSINSSSEPWALGLTLSALCFFYLLPSWIPPISFRSALLIIIAALIFLLVLFLVYLFLLFDPDRLDSASFLLRYVYYSQTKQFKDPIKRRQMILLDTATGWGTKWNKRYRPLLTHVLILTAAPLSVWYLGQLSPLSWVLSTLFLIILPSLLFPLMFDGYISNPSRKLLYNLHTKQHGPMPQEITDIVNKAYELNTMPDPKPMDEITPRPTGLTDSNPQKSSKIRRVLSWITDLFTSSIT